eukprot:jgi/Botrbrau1/13454/Bobra.0082s0057.1
MDWEKERVHYAFSPGDVAGPGHKKDTGQDLPDTGKQVFDRQSGVHGKGLRHVSEGEKKHGDGAHNWGNVKSGEEELEAEIAPVPTAPGEEELGDESPEETERALREAYEPDQADKQTVTLDEYERQHGPV